jgi:hypothetical protein
MKKYAVPVLLVLLIVAVIATRPVSVQPVAWAQSGSLDLADAIVSSRAINIATTADKIEIAAGENSVITLYSSGEIVIKGRNIKFEAEENISLNVKDQSINIDGKAGAESITLGDMSNGIIVDHTNNRLSLLTDNGNINIHSPNGTLDVKATETDFETTGITGFKAANLKFEAQTDFRMKASNIIQEATMDFKMKGMNVRSEASMEYKIKGLNVTSEAGVNQQVKGTMITVQSTGPNTIKGMPVLIN